MSKFNRKNEETESKLIPLDVAQGVGFKRISE